VTEIVNHGCKEKFSGYAKCNKYKVICANFEISGCAGAHPHLYIDPPLDAVVFTMLSTLNLSQCTLFATIMWSIWKRKNLKLWQHKDETNDHIMIRAKTLLEDWKAA